MSWPQWSAGAQPSVPSVLNPATPVINSAPTVVPPGLQYTPDQWAQLQQQNWNQWAQWQQQYQQWQQQYGAEYQKSMNALAQAAQQQSASNLPNVAVPPPLPTEVKPPLPTEDPPPPTSSYTTAPPPTQPINYNTAPPPKPTERPPVSYPKPTQNQPWQQTTRYPNEINQNKRQYEQHIEQEPKRQMLNKQGWQNHPPTTNLSLMQTQPPPPVQQNARPVKENIEELTEAEKKFDKQFAEWEAQFNKWKEQNAEHPDKEQYREYEKKWESWRAQLLERREQMKRKRLGLTGGMDSPNRGRPPPNFNQPPQQNYNSPQQSFNQPPQNYNQFPPKGAQNPIVGQKPFAKPGGLLPTPQAGVPYNKPPNMNDEPLRFKQSKTTPPELDDVGDFIKPNTSGGIPGLDLVKDDPKLQKESDDIVVIDGETERKGPDFDAISKGINTILGDQKLLNMLSIVSQNQNSKINDNLTNTISKIKDTSNPEVPYHEQSNQSYEEHSNQSDTHHQREFINNFDDQTRSSFTMAHNEQEMRYDSPGTYGRSQKFDQNQFPSRFGNRFGGPDGDQFPKNNFARNDFNDRPFLPGRDNHDRFPPKGDNQDRRFTPGPGRSDSGDRFGPGERSNWAPRIGPNDDRSNQDRFGSNSDRFGLNHDRFAPNQDRFGPNGSNQDRFEPAQDRFDLSQDWYGPGQDKFNSNQARFGPEQERFGSERYGLPQERFALIQDRFGPNDRFGGPKQDRFGPNQERFGSNQDRFNTNQERFGLGQDRFGSDRPFGPPRNDFQQNLDEGFGPRGPNDKAGGARSDQGPRPFGFGGNNFNRGSFECDDFEQGPPIKEEYDYPQREGFSKGVDPEVPVEDANLEAPWKEDTVEPATSESTVTAPAKIDILQPATVIDYDHKSLKSGEPEVLIEPIFMFDYRHKPLSRIPLPQRPKWLIETVRNIREFDPPVVRPYEPPNLRRYPPPGDNWRKDRYSEDNWSSHNRWNYNENRPPFEERRSYSDNRSYDETKPFKKDWSPPIDSRNKERNMEDVRHFQNSDFGEEKISDTEWPDDDDEENEQFRPPTPNVEFSKFQKPPHSANKSKTAVLIEDLISPPGRYNRPPRIVIILRGPPGSGKTFLAKLIKDKEVENGGSTPRILSLDDYFMVEQEKEITEEGKKVKIKEMVYEYEAEMEESYRSSLIKSFRKTITDGYFSFIIVDNVNDKVKYFGEMWSFAKQNGFQVYICQLDLDAQTCSKRNIHGRSEADIEKCVAGWEPTPAHHPVVDATSLLQSASIPEVEMEEVNSPESDINEHDGSEDQVARSKWDNFDCSVDNLAKLDGVSKPLRTSRTMEEYLQMDTEWTPIKPTKPGQKRVRWADLEEQKQQEKMRAIGFVVGQTNWERMMDPTGGSSALTQTKYIERTGRYKVDQK